MTTLKDVAREAGVAVSTVSRAFTHPERLNAETVARVKQVAEQLNYRVNPLAKALITGTSPVIGMLVGDIADPFMTAAIKGAQAEAYDHGLWLAVGDTDGVHERELEWSETMSGLARGLILLGAHTPDETLRGIADQVPLVLLQRKVPGVACVYIDSRVAVGTILDRLIAEGHRQVCYVPGPDDRWIALRKLEVFRELCAERNLKATVMPHTVSTIVAGQAMVEDLLERRVTAVICANDRLAQGVIAGLFRRGLRPPDNFSVVGHDDSLRTIAVPTLTTTSDLASEVGRRAVRLLLPEGELKPTTEAVTAEAIFGESSGPVPTTIPH